MLTQDVLVKSGLERFIETANFKHQWLLIETAAVEGRVPNAVFLTIEPYTAAPYTGRAVFEIDRLANGIPYGCVAPAKRNVVRKVLIRQQSGLELLKQFGHGNYLYLGYIGNVPTTTDALAPQFAKRFGLTIAASDIISDPIGDGATNVIVRFSPTSVSYTGAINVDLTTPVYEDQANQL